MLTTFQSCPAKYFLRKAGWVPRRKSAALVGGGVLHYGMAEWYRSANLDAALDAMRSKWPEDVIGDDWRTLDKWIATMRAYAEEYPHESFTIVGAPEAPMVECTFTLDTGLFLDCEHCPESKAIGWIDDMSRRDVCPRCGHELEVIEYGGIFDALIEFGGKVWCLEHKTSSVFPQDASKRDYFWSSFKPNNQLSGYCWASAKMSGLRVGGAMVNAIGVYKVAKSAFGRQITSRSDVAIAEWLTNVRTVCQQIRDCERRGVFPMSTPACTMYGRCEYHDVHSLDNEAEREKLLAQDYLLEPWNYDSRDQESAAGVK